MLRRKGNSRESEKVSELKIDKDCFPDKEWIPFYVRVITKTCSDSDVAVKSISVCESKKKGLHFYIKICPAIDSELANMLQWLMGMILGVWILIVQE
jgi:hypothetical protein